MKVGIIGHVDHGKTTLISAIERALEKEAGIVVINSEEKERGMTINESIKQDNTMMLHSLREAEFMDEIVKTGRENRRERRKRERKNK